VRFKPNKNPVIQLFMKVLCQKVQLMRRRN